MQEEAAIDLKEMVASAIDDPMITGKEKKPKKLQPYEPEDVDKYLNKCRCNQIVFAGIKSKLITVGYDTKKGSLGLDFKKYDLGFFVQSIKEGAQAETIGGVSRGMLIYEISTGTSRIQGYTTKQILKKLVLAFKKKKPLIFRFLVCNPRLLKQSYLPQHTMLIKEKKTKTDKVLNIFKMFT
jgi:hypothetical protein